MNWLRDNWMLLAVLIWLSAHFTGQALTRPAVSIAGSPFIFTDAFTGKQYVVNPAGGIWPRMNDQGRHMTEWEQPR
jgi:hypothetical protein